MIICAALRIQEKDSKQKIIIPCIRHGEGIFMLKDLGIDKEIVAHAEQGFIDNNSQFHSRQEAYEICRENGQLSKSTIWYKEDHNDIELYSEDLY